MPNQLSPGIYPQETDFSFYVKQLSTTACGMVGIAKQGPMHVPTLVTSWDQFVRTFGGYLPASYLAYAARAFYDNGGSILWVTRIAHATDPTDPATLTAVKATVTVNDRAGTPQPTLKVSALTAGTWGDGLSIVIEDGAANPTTEFTLTVKQGSTVLEIFANLSMSEAAANHVEQIINERSTYITVEDLDSVTATPADRPAIGTLSLTGGNDGLTGLTDADYLGDPAAHTGLYAFDPIDAINLLCVPGVTTAPVITGGIAYAEGRRDLLFLADTPLDLTPQEAVEFRTGAGSYSHAAFNSSYAALYYPWLAISDPLTGKRKLVPPVGAVAGCIARSDDTVGVWAAPGGTQRGRLRNVLALAYTTSQPERNVLYPAAVNMIVALPNDGICIMGQKTLQAQSSALDRINVRRLMMHIAEAISQSSLFVVFSPNHPTTWRALERLIIPFLRNLKDNGGVIDFAVQCDEETNTPAVIDRNELVCRVFVKPTKTAEFIELNFILTATGGDFSEVL